MGGVSSGSNLLHARWSRGGPRAGAACAGTEQCHVTARKCGWNGWVEEEHVIRRMFSQVVYSAVQEKLMQDVSGNVFRIEGSEGYCSLFVELFGTFIIRL